MNRKLAGIVTAVVLVLSIPQAAKALDPPKEMTQNGWSTGLLLGFTIAHIGATFAAFTLEIPLEYSFEVGPGALTPHFGFMLTARKNFVAIALPLGIRYKMRVAAFPLYVYPLLDMGPAFDAKAGTASGFLRVGAGLSYVVHPNVELVFQPLGLGAGFNSDDGWFLYNFLLGVQARF